VARALINLDSADVIVGPQGSAMALAAGAVAEASQVPLVSPMSSSPAVTADRKLVTRLAFLDAFQGEVLARYAFDSLGLRRAAVLFNASSTYGREITTLFRSTFEQLGGEVVGVETFNADVVSDRADQLANLVAEKPDALLLPNFTSPDSLQFRTARGLGFRGRFLGTDSWDGIALMRREDVQGVVLVANWDRRGDRASLRDFLSLWDQRYPDERPRATAAATYDAVRLLARAAERAGVKSGVAVVDSLRSAGQYDGAFGRYWFRGTGDPVRGAVLLEISLDSTVLRAAIDPQP
jgi:branched-chain amino acid transport system substrate-binding protein